MDIASACSGKCEDCANCNHCLAGHGEDHFVPKRRISMGSDDKHHNKPDYKMKIEIITGKSHIKMRDLDPGDWFTTDGVTGPPLMKLNPVNLGIFSCVGLTGNLYNVGDDRVVCPLKSTVPHCMEHANAV